MDDDKSTIYKHKPAIWICSDSMSREPHDVLWIIAIVLILAASFFGLFADLIGNMMIMSGVFVVFYLLDGIIFDIRGNSPVTLLSNNLFISRRRAFPMFLVEIFLFTVLSNNWVEPFVRNIVQNEISNPWVIIGWFGVLYVLFIVKIAKED